LQAQSCEKLAVPNQWVVKYRDDKRPRLVHAPSKTALEKTISHGRIEWIEANYALPRPQPLAVKLSAPSEDELAFQETYDQKTGAEYAWSQGFLGDGIVVAVVDSGVDLKEPRLAQAIDVNTLETLNGLDDDHNGYVDDIYGWNFTNNTGEIVDETGHGTHIAGIIAADHSTTWSRGLAPHSRILAVDFVSSEKGDEFSALQAVQYAVDRGAQVINNSWSSACSAFLQNAFQKWQSENIVFVSSSGNDGRDLNEYPLSPANLDLTNHITVGAYGSDFRRSSFSNTGPTVAVLAPGEMILSLAPLGTADDNLILRSGTSMAAAFVSGAIAIAWSHRPDLTASQLVAVFKDVHKAKKPGGDPRALDIRGFLNSLDQQYPPPGSVGP